MRGYLVYGSMIYGISRRMRIIMKLSSLKGIGQKTEQLFTKAGITDTSQLPYYYPRSYDIYKEPVLISEIDEDGIYTLYLSIASDVEVKPMKKLNITTVFAVDEQNERIKLTCGLICIL